MLGVICVKINIGVVLQRKKGFLKPALDFLVADPFIVESERCSGIVFSDFMEWHIDDLLLIHCTGQ